ncbi:hypothetical protein [Lederbergia citrea]|uniref:Uncharacterized protein n=1 Tax=Lederbergia citrea TaxID=2833581 RepID=A0A942UHT8_9BACI|nr:hypothetical protein [Lederbergia citrea]MBS4221736.1 hypothetical protein [Lederbergia citrea]
MKITGMLNQSLSELNAARRHADCIAVPSRRVNGKNPDQLVIYEGILSWQ